MESRLLYARQRHPDEMDEDDAHPVKADSLLKDPDGLTCYLCDWPLSLVPMRETLMPSGNKKKTGAHFTHRRDEDGRKVACKWKADTELCWHENGVKRAKNELLVRSESPEHVMSKLIVKERPVLKFQQKCAHCKQFHFIDVHNNSFATECHLDYMALDRSFRYDVVYVDTETREPRGVVEICDTHANPKEKNDSLCAAKLPWVEVTTAVLLNRGTNDTVRVLNSSLMDRHGRCPQCQTLYLSEKSRLDARHTLLEQIDSLRAQQQRLGERRELQQKTLEDRSEKLEMGTNQLMAERQSLRDQADASDTIEQKRLRAVEIKKVSTRLNELKGRLEKTIRWLCGDLLRIESEHAGLETTIQAIQEQWRSIGE